jgi:peptidoglycan hydrolase-like protein with peptidoglycan-binding domain
MQVRTGHKSRSDLRKRLAPAITVLVRTVIRAGPAPVPTASGAFVLRAHTHVLQVGARGRLVRAIQAALVRLSYLPERHRRQVRSTDLARGSCLPGWERVALLLASEGRAVHAVHVSTGAYRTHSCIRIPTADATLVRRLGSIGTRARTRP